MSATFLFQLPLHSVFFSAPKALTKLVDEPVGDDHQRRSFRLVLEPVLAVCALVLLLHFLCTIA